MSPSATSTRPQGGQDIMNGINFLVKSGRTETTERSDVRSTRLSMDTSSKVLQRWYLGSCLFICWISSTYLNALLESPMLTVILVTNNGKLLVRRTSDIVSHGKPVDLIDRYVKH